MAKQSSGHLYRLIWKNLVLEYFDWIFINMEFINFNNPVSVMYWRGNGKYIKYTTSTEEELKKRLYNLYKIKKFDFMFEYINSICEKFNIGTFNVKRVLTTSIFDRAIIKKYIIKTEFGEIYYKVSEGIYLHKEVTRFNRNTHTLIHILFDSRYLTYNGYTENSAIEVIIENKHITDSCG